MFTFASYLQFNFCMMNLSSFGICVLRWSVEVKPTTAERNYDIIINLICVSE